MCEQYILEEKRYALGANPIPAAAPLNYTYCTESCNFGVLGVIGWVWGGSTSP